VLFFKNFLGGWTKKEGIIFKYQQIRKAFLNHTWTNGIEFGVITALNRSISIND
jgi:hypothetical protein